MSVPKYQVAKQAIAKICDRNDVGFRLPSESQIGRHLDISRITVRRAMDELESEGIVRRVQGSGTFVQAHPTTKTTPSEVMAPLGFHAQMSCRGHRVDSKVIFRDQVKADSDTATGLGIKIDTVVNRLQRLRFLDGSLHHLTTAWWPTGSVTIPSDVDFASASLYSSLADAGIVIDSEQVTVSIRTPNGDEAALLQIGQDQPCLASTSRVFTSTGKQVLYSQTLRRATDATMTFTIKSRHESTPKGSTNG